MWESTFSDHLDLKIEWRKSDTEAVGMPHKWGKGMENPKLLMIIRYLRVNSIECEGTLGSWRA